MRQAVTTALLLSLSACCCNPMKQESYASVPLTMKEVKALEQDGATVTVERKSRHSVGNIACGHSPLCVIFLPVILYDAAFPETWDAVVVKRGDETVLVAEYTTGGALIHAQHLVDGEMRETRFIELRALNKKVYVDSARLVAQTDGGVERVVLPLSSQHDFIAEERAFLDKQKDPKRRAEAITEARQQLEAEGLTFAIERLKDPAEDDRTRGLVIGDGCVPELIAAATPLAGPWTKLSLVSCAPAGEARAPLLRELAELVCQGVQDGDLQNEIEYALMRDDAQVADVPKRCANPGPRALLGLWLKQPVTAADLDALLASDAGRRAQLHLNSKDPVQRAAMLRLFLDDKNAKPVLSRFISEQAVLEPAQLASLATYYLKPREFFATATRADVLQIFDYGARAKDAATRTQPAREVLATALTKTKDKDDVAALRAALLVLGDGTQPVSVTEPVPLGRATVPSELPAYALRLLGCDTEALRQIAAGAKKASSCGPRPAEQP